jgi:hypothetical protein
VTIIANQKGLLLTCVRCARDKRIPFRRQFLFVNNGHRLYDIIRYALGLRQADVTRTLLAKEASFSPQICVRILIVRSGNLNRTDFISAAFYPDIIQATELMITCMHRDSDITTGSNIWSQVPQGCSIPRHTD